MWYRKYDLGRYGLLPADLADNLYYLATHDNVQGDELTRLTDGLVHTHGVTYRQVLTWIEKKAGGDRTTWTPVEAKTDDDLQQVFKPRIPQDLRIRRLRLIDMWKQLTTDERRELGWLTHLDYIFVSNLIVYAKLWGFDKLTDIRHSGILNSRDIFTEVSPKLNSYIKKQAFTPNSIKQYFAEINCLTGFQQLPYPGFDVFEEAEKLANSGCQHGLRDDNFKLTFKNAMQQICTSGVDKQTHRFRTFEEYIKSHEWARSGSSSIGRVNWERDDKKGHFKARKNLLTDLYTDDELIKRVMEWDGTLESKAIIKSEMAKVRLAVASPVEAYLLEAYLLDIAGHPYTQWDGVTLDESPTQQVARENRTRLKFRQGCWALPFDYAAFDHQPETWEVQTIMDLFTDMVKSRTPIKHHDELQLMIAKVRTSYEKSYLVATYEGETRKYKVAGGVPSGIRATSILGNMWNSIMTRIARNLATEIIGYDPVVDIAIRGDDSLILCRKPAHCYIFRECYRGINAMGANTKFSILPKEGEFLRNTITAEGVRGWSNRAIPGLIQRKPWNSEPWTPRGWVTTLVTGARTLERRARVTCEWLHNVIKAKWSHYTKQSNRWLELPTHMGGWGLYPWKGWVTDRKLPLAQKPTMRFTNLSEPHAYDWIELDKQQLAEVQQSVVQAKVAADDIPGVCSDVNKRYITALRKLEVKWTFESETTCKPYYVEVPDDSPLVQVSFPKYTKPRVLMVSSTPGWPRLPDFVRQYNEVARVVKVPSLGSFVEQHYPVAYEFIKGYERAGWHRTDAFNIAMGDVPTEPVPVIHPQLTCYVKRALDASGVLQLRGRANIARKLAIRTRYAEERVARSAFAINHFAY